MLDPGTWLPENVPVNPDPPALDPKVLEQLRELERAGTAGFVAQLASLFLKQTQEQAGVLRACLASKDDAGLARSAHLLKGSSGSVGATALMEISRELEAAAKSKSWAEAEALIGRWEAEFIRVRVALQREGAA
jgi:HPt (histidine-containing phosphotransfer) domain-containing protein